MSFSDLMSSGRGPGVIGMLLALVVLIGFGVLFMFAFDEGFQGAGQTIESVIAQQAKDIEGIKESITSGGKELAKVPALQAVEKQLRGVKTENQYSEGRIDSLKQAIVKAKEDLVAKNREIDAYKDAYRTFVRGKAKGETIARLETRKGEIYENVTIREVTAIGVQILHDGGQKRIPFEDMPEAMQDRFQFDPKQKAAAIAKENATRDEHETAVSMAKAAVSQQAADQKEKDAQDLREKTIRAIAVKSSRIESLKLEIKALELALPNEAQKRISHAPQMKLDLVGKKRDLAALQDDVARLSASL